LTSYFIEREKLTAIRRLLTAQNGHQLFKCLIFISPDELLLHPSSETLQDKTSHQ
jgi:hypothetical protein